MHRSYESYESLSLQAPTHDEIGEVFTYIAQYCSFDREGKGEAPKARTR